MNRLRRKSMLIEDGAMEKLYAICNKYTCNVMVMDSGVRARIAVFLVNLIDSTKPFFIVEVDRSCYPYKIEDDNRISYGYFKTFADASEFLECELKPFHKRHGTENKNYYIYKRVL